MNYQYFGLFISIICKQQIFKATESEANTKQVFQTIKAKKNTI